MRLSGSLAALAAAGALAAGCGAGSLTSNPGTAGSGGSGGVIEGEPLLLSDFEDLQRAVVVQEGTPTRNGYWYAYQDGSAGCVQQPLPGAVYVGAPPPVLHPGSGGSLALHGDWQSCNTSGAGIGADFAVPFTSAITYSGPKVPYDVTRFVGVMFWAMAAPGSATHLRVTFPLRAGTRVEAGGACASVNPLECGDEWGEQISLPVDGSWRQFFVRFSDPAFRQEGLGGSFPWNPADVTGIHIQSVDKAGRYDFWIDDMYFVR